MFIWYCNGNSTNLHANFFPIYTVTSPTPQNSAIDKDNKFCLSFFVQSKFLIYLKTNILKKKKLEKASDYIRKLFWLKIHLHNL